MTAIPPSIRTLPMSTEEFSEWSVEDIQQKFFLEDLPFRSDGGYLHYRYGLKTPSGSVVLFQYRNVLVASAIFRDASRFAEPDENGYEGMLYFQPTSIRVFVPIDSNVVSRIWPAFRRFSHVKQSLDPNGYLAFERELRNVRIPTF
jgi:hypothetical protein